MNQPTQGQGPALEKSRRYPARFEIVTIGLDASGVTHVH
jgi:hypothetical protein